jgi:Nucleotidyl transferase AbiEii toxin, Type IV TA system
VTPVRRDSVGGRAYLDVQDLARRSGRPTAELLHLYALEGFLDRLSRSERRNRLVLKGGMLLAVWDARRPTRDIDLAARQVPGEVEAVRLLVREVANVAVEDGLVFESDAVTADTIRDHDRYTGVRVTVPGRLSRAVFRFHVDVNVADPIELPPSAVDLPRLLGGEPVPVLGYPLVMVLAEKIVTMVERDAANTRWRDFADVYTLTRDRDIERAGVRAAVAVVSAHRGVQPRPLAGLMPSFPVLAQPR